jgi:SH3-like domain-containing protein
MSRVRALRDIRLRTAAILMLAQICGSAAGQAQPLPAGFAPYRPPAGMDIRISEYSGQPVPRYASLRYDKVNGRHNPDDKAAIDWTYTRRGLPVIVVRESNEWWRIRDPEGSETWIRSSQLAGNRTVVATAPGAILKKAEPGAAEQATFVAGSVLQLKSCVDGWCRVEAEGRAGYALERLFWGVAALPAE